LDKVARTAAHRLDGNLDAAPAVITITGNVLSSIECA